MRLVDISSLWGSFKFALGKALDLSQDALHIHVGVLMFLGFAVLLRGIRGGAVWAWAMTLALECANEFIDLHQKFGSPESNWPASRHDIWNTMLAPSLILAFLWWRDQRPRRR